MSNFDEYLAGTDPRLRQLDAQDHRREHPRHGPVCFLMAPAWREKLYRVTTSDDLLVTWTPLTTLLPTTSGAQSMTLDTGGATKLFVRVEIAP